VARYQRGERERVWREVIRDQAVSGLSISAFCRDRKVSPASFYNWRRKLAGPELAHAATRDVETRDAVRGQNSTDGERCFDDAAIASKFVALDLPLSAAAELQTDLPDPSETGPARTLREDLPAAAQTVSRPRCEVVLPDGCRVIVSAGCDALWLREILAVVRDTSGMVQCRRSSLSSRPRLMNNRR
jgi:hypothetical protein